MLKSQRYEALDGLRGIAALFIVLVHIRWSNHLTSTNFARNGFLFVDLFFMLSGFVLASAYLSKINSLPNVRQFLRLRFFRIYPLHLATLTALIALELGKLFAASSGLMAADRRPFSNPNSVTDIAYNLVLIQSLNVTDHVSWNIQSWVISCEAACCAVFAFATLAGVTRFRAFGMIAMPLAIACYTFIFFQKGTLRVSYDFGFLRGLAGFALGVWAFQLSRTTRISSMSARTLGHIALGLAAWIIGALYFAHGVTEAAVLPAFFLAILFVHQDAGVPARFLSSRGVQFLGTISYSIFLLHVPIIILVNIALKFLVSPSARLIETDGTPSYMLNPWLGDLLVAGAVVLIVGSSAVTLKLIEEPWREFGRGGRSINPAQAILRRIRMPGSHCAR